MTSYAIKLMMNRVVSFVLMAMLVSGFAHVANGITLRASDATVSGAGETATICVDLETGGEDVAGTQNELVWDSTCATLTGLRSCEASSAHGKDLHASFPNGDGLPPLRAFVFSMKNVGPMPDGELYCCDFTSELVNAGSCSIEVRAARASDPNGKALSATGANGSILMRGAGGGGVVSGGVTGGAATGGGATGGATGGSGGQGTGAAAGGAGGVTSGLGQAPSQVLPGGVPAEEPVDTEALAQAARDAAREEAERIIERQIPDQEGFAEEEVDVVEPTVEPEPTEEPTPAAPPTAPAAKATEVRPTPKAPTMGRTPAAAAAAAQAPKEESRSWFGCQVSTNGDGGGSIFLLIGVAGVLVNRLRRRPGR